MMMILSGAWPQATALPAGPGGRGRRPRPGKASARPAAAKPAPAPAGPQGQAMACARYKDGSLAAEPLVIYDIHNKKPSYRRVTARCVLYHCKIAIGNESVLIQLEQCQFPGLAISSGKILIHFLIKYTEVILSNSTRKLLWFEITKC